METTTDATVVRREITIEARPETVWEFLVDPEKATRWMGGAAALDPRPGGEYRVEVLSGNVARGEFVELDPPRRAVWTWGWEGGASSVGPGESTVEVELVAAGDHTTLQLTHALRSSDEAERHGVGWDHYLPRLAIAAAGGDPGRDPWTV
jgi:uncharacterized protein YndB with AHSA1/START domain